VAATSTIETDHQGAVLEPTFQPAQEAIVSTTNDGVSDSSKAADDAATTLKNAENAREGRGFYGKMLKSIPGDVASTFLNALSSTNVQVVQSGLQRMYIAYASVLQAAVNSEIANIPGLDKFLYEKLDQRELSWLSKSIDDKLNEPATYAARRSLEKAQDQIQVFLNDQRKQHQESKKRTEVVDWLRTNIVHITVPALLDVDRTLVPDADIDLFNDMLALALATKTFYEIGHDYPATTADNGVPMAAWKKLSVFHQDIILQTEPAEMFLMEDRAALHVQVRDFRKAVIDLKRALDKL
jgi:hypothetical protein